MKKLKAYKDLIVNAAPKWRLLFRMFMVDCKIKPNTCIKIAVSVMVIN